MSVTTRNNKFTSNNFSTCIQESHSQSRVFKLYQTKQTRSPAKACNLNDKQRRIQRNHTAIFQTSTQQSSLFEKGVKKIQPQAQEAQKPETIKRDYRNKQTYDILRPTSTELKFNEGGVRKIYLYDQRKESNLSRSTSQSRKKFLKEFNKETEARDQPNVYFVKKLPTHKNVIPEWHNQMTKVQLKKKQNILNEENLKKEQNEKPVERENRVNKKNMSQITIKEGGVTLQSGKNQIDFRQNYYQREREFNKSGFHSSRQYR